MMNDYVIGSVLHVFLILDNLLGGTGENHVSPV
jgi:hypothetical protein